MNNPFIRLADCKKRTVGVIATLKALLTPACSDWVRVVVVVKERPA
jgi:hypothetical protein